MAARHRVRKCAEEDRHRAKRLAETQVFTWLLNYQEERGLSDIDMLGVLAEAQQLYVGYLDRNDEERRTGFRHRMAGE